MVAAAVVGAATSVVGAYASDRASKRQAKALKGQQGTAQQQLDFGKEKYGDWKEMFQPVYGDLKNMAYEDNRPDYGAIDADVGHAFDTSQGINRRNMERFGVNPTDGAFSASETQYGLGRAMAEVGGHQQARRQAKDQKWNRLASFANLGAGQQATANNTVNQGFGAVMNAQGTQAGLYGQQANEYAQMAASGAGLLGRALSQNGNNKE